MGTGGTAPYGLANRRETYPRAAIHGRPSSKAREAGFSIQAPQGGATHTQADRAFPGPPFRPYLIPIAHCG